MNSLNKQKSAADYLNLVKEFDFLVLDHVPALNIYSKNESRRFITLVDALYDQKKVLVASFETGLADIFSGDIKATTLDSADRLLFDDLKLDPEQLQSSIFTGKEEVFAFQRAVSRLAEMQGIRWIGQDKADLINQAISFIKQ